MAMGMQLEILGTKPHHTERILDVRPLAALNMRHGATVAQIVEQLRADIIEGRLPPGARLVESQMTDRFVVSRGPVREAFGRLQAEGFIELPRNRGAYVKRLHARDVAELFDIRAELETLAARRAATNAQRNARARKRLLQLGTERTVERNGKAAAWVRLNERFHGAVFELAGNRSLEKMCSEVQFPFVVSQILLSMSDDEMHERMQDHSAIAAAIVDGDENIAGALMRAHIQATAAIALTHIEPDED
jgi:DNA-binding GntR family transcriptional regulator